MHSRSYQYSNDHSIMAKTRNDPVNAQHDVFKWSWRDTISLLSLFGSKDVQFIDTLVDKRFSEIDMSSVNDIGDSSKVDQTRDSRFALPNRTDRSRKLFVESLKRHQVPAFASSHQTQQLQSVYNRSAASTLFHGVNDQLVHALVACPPPSRNKDDVHQKDNSRPWEDPFQPLYSTPRVKHMTNSPISMNQKPYEKSIDTVEPSATSWAPLNFPSAQGDVDRTLPLIVNQALKPLEADFPFYEKKRGASLFQPSNPRSRLNVGKTYHLSIDKDSFAGCPKDMTCDSPPVAFVEVKHGDNRPVPSQSSVTNLAKRRFDDSSSTEPLRHAAAKSPVQHSPFLLHHCCKRHSQSVSAVSAVLRVNPQDARRRFPRSRVAFLKRRKESEFDYPINIALHHDASLQVLRLLAEASSDILIDGDGPEWCSSLSCALYERRGIQVIRLLLEAHPDQVRVRDRHLNYPIHVACLCGASLEIIKLVAISYRRALRRRNFHGQTPVDIAIRSTLCGNDAADFLKQASYEPLEGKAIHLDG